MTFRESLRTKFLKWVSDSFDVVIVTATQKQKDGLAINKVYELDSMGDPFRNTVYVKICDIKGDHVQYVSCSREGHASRDGLKMSNTIKTFKVCYKEVENNAS